jgi:hypothetical protein
MMKYHYGNSNREQREYIENRIRTELGVCQSALVDELMRAGFDGFTWDEVENVYPDPEEWTLAQCREYIREHVGDEPGDCCFRPSDMDRAMCVELLEGAGIACGDDDSLDVLRDAVEANIDDETLDGLEAWREAVTDCAEPQEVFEWWVINDTFLADDLRNLGEPILDNGYGRWWGRGSTGQSIALDPTFWVIFQGQVAKLA